MVPASSHKVSRVSWYSGSRLAAPGFAYGAFTLSGWLSQNHSAKLIESIPRSEPRSARTPVWALSISLAATLEIDVSFSSSGYLDVSVHRVPHAWLWIHHTLTELFSAGFPHSDISGSLDICSSPKLFAAYHVFHRLLVPRHPPCALFCITNLPNSFESILTGLIFRESLLSKERSCFVSDICEANVTERILILEGLSILRLTCIALHVLVLSANFLLCFLQSVVIITTVSCS